MGNTFKNIQKNKVPSKVLSEEDKASAILRDNFNQDFVSISFVMTDGGRNEKLSGSNRS
jgi:hypothetical protein